MPTPTTNGLSDAQVETFIEDGFVRLDGAVPPDLVRRCQHAIWSAMFLSPDQPNNWSRPVVWIPFLTDPPIVEAANTPALHGAYDRLVGEGRWRAPNGLGSFPVRFPSAEATGDDGWHVDMSFGTDAADFMDWRINVTSRGRALLMLFLFSDVGPIDAPTRIRIGSHKMIARALLPHGPGGLSLRQLVAGGLGGSETCREVAATGTAGTVYLCHPFLVHAAQANRGTRPRLMAQPALIPRGEFEPRLPPSPVQMAIRRACNLAI